MSVYIECPAHFLTKTYMITTTLWISSISLITIIIISTFSYHHYHIKPASSSQEGFIYSSLIEGNIICCIFPFMKDFQIFCVSKQLKKWEIPFPIFYWIILVQYIKVEWFLSDLSDSLTVAHFLWAIWAICSQLLICLERSERIAHSCSFDLSKMSEWAMSKFPAMV